MEKDFAGNVNRLDANLIRKKFLLFIQILDILAIFKFCLLFYLDVILIEKIKGAYNLRVKSVNPAENSKEKSNPPKSYGKRLQILEAELERLKLKAGICLEIDLEWSPGIVRHKNGKQLLEEVEGNTIFIYEKDLDKAIPLLTHAFLELLLNQNTKRYRLLINKLIEVFEQIQYEEKEKVINTLTKFINKQLIQTC